ncbi:MAG: BON domain-containing protein [Acidobacteriota bacterium]
MLKTIYRFGTVTAALLVFALAFAVVPAWADEDYESQRMDDAVLELKVKTALLSKLGWDAMDLKVTAIGSRIVLGGEADSKAHQELAKEVALSVDGVETVMNQIRLSDKASKKAETSEDESKTPVADTVGAAVEDAELEIRDAVLESRVKTKLIEEMGLTAFSIEVEATDGTVSLRGALKDRARVRLAKKVVRDVRGVDKVIDLLEVKKD